MNKRKLGNSGLEVAPLAFGGNVFGWTVDEPTAFRLLDAFVDAGFNLIDTADMYPKWVPGNKGGESETIIGHWLKRDSKRKKVVIATKVGAEMLGRTPRTSLWRYSRYWPPATPGGVDSRSARLAQRR